MFSFSKTKIPIANSSKSPIDKLMNNDKILGNILKNLHGEDLKSCRLVCRKWRNVVQPQFKSEMNVVFEESNTKMPVGNRKRDFKSFFEDFNGCDEGLPLESVKFIKIHCVVKENLWSVRWLGSFGGLIKNLTVVGCHSERQLLMNQLWAFRNIIFSYFHNLENLTLIFIATENKMIFSSRKRSYGLSWINFGRVAKIELPGLKSIKYFVHEKSSWDQDRKNEVMRTLFDLITSTKNLQILEMNLNPTHTYTLLRIPLEHLKTLRELSLLDWNCRVTQVDESIRNLGALGQKGKLQLESFSLQCICCPSDEYNGIKDILSYSKFLLIFLKSQKECLKVLDLTHPPFPRSALNAEFKDPFFDILKAEDDFIFPKLEKLEKLSLCYSYRNFVWAFSSCSNWTELFPQLKIFDYHYIIESGNSTFPQLMNSMIIPCGSVTEINLAVNTYVFGKYLSPTENEKIQSLRLFRLVREKFPNIKRLTVPSEKYSIYEGGVDGFPHFTKTYIIWSVGHNNSEQIFVNEYNVVLEKKTADFQQESRSWLPQFIGKLQCCQCCDSDDSN